MTRVNLGVKYSKLEGFYKCVKPRLEKTDYSYTNAVIIPKYYKIKSLRNANLEGVDMRGVDLTDIDITGANLLGTGADITGSIGECLGVSAYEPKRVLVSKKMITPMQFEKITGLKAIAPYNQKYVNEYFPWENRVLRQYDLSCINYNEYINQIYEENEDKQFKGLVEYVDSMYCRGLDFSYTNIDIDPQQFTEQLVLNLEGVDLRDKDFRGKEKLFAYCNLKGTGANISPRINPTVSEYIVPTKERKK